MKTSAVVELSARDIRELVSNHIRTKLNLPDNAMVFISFQTQMFSNGRGVGSTFDGANAVVTLES